MYLVTVTMYKVMMCKRVPFKISFAQSGWFSFLFKLCQNAYLASGGVIRWYFLMVYHLVDVHKLPVVYHCISLPCRRGQLNVTRLLIMYTCQ